MPLYSRRGAEIDDRFFLGLARFAPRSDPADPSRRSGLNPFRMRSRLFMVYLPFFFALVDYVLEDIWAQVASGPGTFASCLTLPT
jgi:hypothetical protein